MKAPLSLMTCAVLLSLSAGTASAADWSDNSVSYRYGSAFHEPGNDKDVKKNIFTFTHVSGFKYGSNFFNVDALVSDKNDPANNSTTSGAQELYALYSNQLHYSKITGNKISFGPINDFAWTNRIDINSKNSAFASRVRKYITGPTIKFGGSLGWADLDFLSYKEKNYNGIVGKAVDFDLTYRVGTAWGLGFNAGPVPLKFNGWGTYTGSKGKDGFGAETKAETWINAFLMVDVGKMATGKGDTFLAGVGYEYIKNKFGADGSNTHTPMLKAEWHL
jgi:hypothetical protein